MKDHHYEAQREILIDYLNLMVSRGVWHGVSDAANDLRVLEAEQNAHLRVDLAKVGEVGTWRT